MRNFGVFISLLKGFKDPLFSAMWDNKTFSLHFVRCGANSHRACMCVKTLLEKSVVSVSSGFEYF